MASEACQEQDMLAVVGEVQRMIESAGWVPLSITSLGKQLSMQCHMYLLKHNIGLLGAIQQFPRLFKIKTADNVQMVTCVGVPWLGPPLPHQVNGGQTQGPALLSAVPNSCMPTTTVPTSCVGGNGTTMSSTPSGMPRGKAVEMMGELAESPAMRDALREIASLLSQAPKRTLLVSEVGSRLSAPTRNVLRTMKIRVAQLLQCFPDDFQLTGSGPGTSASYQHDFIKEAFVPKPKSNEVNNGRYYRLLKLCADVTEHYTNLRSIGARDVQGETGSLLLVDCRSAAERAVSIIPGSVPVSQITDADLSQPRMVVAYCCIGARASAWCNQQTNQGMWGFKLRYLIGGIAAWVHQEGQLVDPNTNQPTKSVHCWVPELATFFPTGKDGVDCVVGPAEDDMAYAYEILQMASDMRFARFQNLAWEVRMRYWPGVFCLEAHDLKAKCATQQKPAYLMVDCRTSEERQVSTLLTGLPLISADEFRANAYAFLNGYDLIVTFCTIGGRSGIFSKKIVDELVESGYCTEDVLRRKIVNLLGGVAAWLHSKGALMTPNGEVTQELHPWCRAFLDMLPIQGVRLVFDETKPVPQDALTILAVQNSSPDKPENTQAAVPQKLLQMYNTIPPEVITDSLTRAMENCSGYED